MGKGGKGKEGKKGKKGGKRRDSDASSDSSPRGGSVRSGKGGNGGAFGARTIYCGNLSWSVSWQDLKDFCKEIGEVEHAECLQYADGRKTGSGIVRFKHAEDAQRAINEYNDCDLKGRPIFIREDKEGGKGPGSMPKGKGKQYLPDHLAEKQVYVGNLSYRTSWQTLKDHMAWIGEVEFCDVMLNRDGDKAGYGLVRYKNKNDVQRCIEELVDSYLDGRKIFVREDKDGFAIKGASDKGKGKGGKGKEWSVWVGPIDKEMEWKELKDAFKAYEPTHATVGEMRNGKNRGFGIVKFAKASEAERAIDEVTEINGEKIACKWDNEQ